MVLLPAGQLVRVATRRQGVSREQNGFLKATIKCIHAVNQLTAVGAVIGCGPCTILTIATICECLRSYHAQSIMGILDDGGSGKSKILDTRQRNHVLTAVCAVGVCIGIMASERLYIATNREDILKGVTTHMGGGVRGSSSSSSTGSASTAAALAAAAPSAGVSEASVAGAVASNPELKALREYLELVAPEKEVLIGVSNQNPMVEGMLDTWLEGVKQAGVSRHGELGKLPHLVLGGERHMGAVGLVLHQYGVLQ